ASIIGTALHELEGLCNDCAYVLAGGRARLVRECVAHVLHPFGALPLFSREKRARDPCQPREWLRNKPRRELQSGLADTFGVVAHSAALFGRGRWRLLRRLRLRLRP